MDSVETGEERKVKPEREKVKEAAIGYQHGIGAPPRAAPEKGAGTGRMGDKDKVCRTPLHCPWCGRSPHVGMTFGNVDVWCRHCKKAFVAEIKPKRNLKGKEVEPKKDDGEARGE